MRFRHAAPLLVLAGLVLALDLAAWRLVPSQPPSPSTPEGQQEPLAQAGTEQEQSGLREALAQQNVSQHAKKQDEATPAEWWSTASVIQVVSAAVTAIATGFIALHTIRLSRISRDQASVLADTLSTNREIERAYIHTSYKPPGLVYDATSGIYSVDLVVANLGNTPAQISGSLLQVSASELTPDEPPYDDDRRSDSAYWLLKGDSVVRHSDGGFDEYQTAWIGDSTRRLRVFVFGYVDYMDRFGRRHRHGFGRRYEPSDSGYNLRFIPEPGYNYDRERKPGEGNDWDEPTQ